MKRGLARLWYKFKNRYFRKERRSGEPLRFLCGSEEELRRVTTWFCHARPQLFSEDKVAVVQYWMNPVTEQIAGTVACVMDQRDICSAPPEAEWELNERWGSLVGHYNTFAGTEWIRDCKWLFCSGWDEIPSDVHVVVQPPSAHESGKALRSLSEWLDGKVSEQDKRELLQLPHDVER